MIEVKNLTLKYPNGKGVFNLNFKVNKGEVCGYLGPNGAGKTTTIRNLLGFTKPDSGSCSIGGFDCITKAPDIQKILGYIPGEIAFLDGMNGDEFLKFMCEMRGTKDLSRQKQLIDMFELDTRGKIKRFSKGMKQKVGIVTAFMHNPDVIILDEPTSGLDPLMQNRFVELILEEKKKGKTILMSSHMFEEIERTCDNVLIIKDGKIVSKSSIENLKNSQRKAFIIKFANINDIEELKKLNFELNIINSDTAEVFVKGENIDTFIKTLAKLTILNVDMKLQSLEDIFLHFYGQEVKKQ